MKMSPEALSAAAGKVLTASQTLRTGWQDAAPPLVSLAAGAAGDSAEGNPLIAAQHRCVDAADGALEAFAGVLEYASEALYRCAFDLVTTDESVADSLRVS